MLHVHDMPMDESLACWALFYHHRSMPTFFFISDIITARPSANLSLNLLFSRFFRTIIINNILEAILDPLLHFCSSSFLSLVLIIVSFCRNLFIINVNSSVSHQDYFFHSFSPLFFLFPFSRSFPPFFSSIFFFPLSVPFSSKESSPVKVTVISYARADDLPPGATTHAHNGAGGLAKWAPFGFASAIGIIAGSKWVLALPLWFSA